jgi:hypothetical protein
MFSLICGSQKDITIEEGLFVNRKETSGRGDEGKRR